MINSKTDNEIESQSLDFEEEFKIVVLMEYTWRLLKCCRDNTEIVNRLDGLGFARNILEEFSEFKANKELRKFFEILSSKLGYALDIYKDEPKNINWHTQNSGGRYCTTTDTTFRSSLKKRKIRIYLMDYIYCLLKNDDKHVIMQRERLVRYGFDRAILEEFIRFKGNKVLQKYINLHHKLGYALALYPDEICEIDWHSTEPKG